MGNGVVNGSAMTTVRVAVTDMLKALFCMAFVEEKINIVRYLILISIEQVY